jgi:effector-binding domain-containing protein
MLEGVDSTMVCVPVAKAGKTSGRITAMETKAGRAVKMNYWGDYGKMSAAHNAILDYISQKHLTRNGAPWEVYITDPMNEKDTAKWLTQIYYPVQ